jgi:Xaa-Pro aminopeptidase
MLDPAQCRGRQRRLLDVMHRDGLDVIVLGSPHHVYYFTGYRPFWLHEAAFVLDCDGRSRLSCGREPEAPVAADDVRAYESNWLGTQRQEQARLAVAAADVPAEFHRAGFDASIVSSQLDRQDLHWQPVDEDLWQLRRQKDPDELALMRRAIACTEAMHRRAREVIEPGVPELTVYTALHAAAVDAAGEPLWPAYLGNDFAGGVPGGPPRAGRAAEAGELYILDLGPAFRGYFADNSRAYAVDRKPTDEQLAAWQTVTGVFPIIERMAKPGVRCRDLFAAVDDYYRARTGNSFPHHLGHGVGLQPHEFPHLNPKWEDVLMEGEVFTVEPGLYGPNLRGGMRIENQYVVTANGVENLTPFPMEL